MLVSIVVPTYNRLKFLPDALQSILSQSYKNWELWVVDDASTDGTQEGLKDFIRQLPPEIQSRIHVLTHTHNQGVSVSRNHAIKKAKGEWISFLDSDDIWHPNKLEKQLSLRSQYSIIHSEEIWYRKGKRVNPMKKHQKSGGRLFLKSLPLCCISPSTVMIHRQVFQEVGLFREDFPVCEDYELWLRISERYEVGFIETPLIDKRGGHEDQLSHQYKAMDYWRVKALMPFLNSQRISQSEKQAVVNMILTKAEILIRGYQKHQNWQNLNEVESYRDLALSFQSSLKA